MKAIIFSFISWKTFVLLCALAAAAILPANYLYSPVDLRIRFPYLYWIWSNFDGLQYILIGQAGYVFGQQPYFPFYPWLMRLLFSFSTSTPYLYRALIISNAAFFLSLFVLWRIMAIDGYSHLRYLLLFLIAIYPTSFYYGAAYNDSLFFLLATLSLLSARKKNWLAAGLCGGMASLTRLNGLAIFFPVVIEYFVSVNGLDAIAKQWNIRSWVGQWRKFFAWKRYFTDGFFGIFLIAAGFFIHLYNIQTIFGNWRQLFTSMDNWRQNIPTFPLQVMWRYLKIILINSPAETNYWVAVVEVLSVCFYIFFLAIYWKKIRLSYWIFFLISILIPGITGTFQGMPRYSLHVYPFFLMLTLFFYQLPRWAKITYVCLSLSLAFLFIALFTRGYFIA